MQMNCLKVVIVGMAGRKKRNIGRLPKAIVQSAGKNERGRPRKRNGPELSSLEADTSQATSQATTESGMIQIDHRNGPELSSLEADTSQATLQATTESGVIQIDHRNGSELSSLEADTSQATTESVLADSLPSINFVSILTESPLNLPSDLWSIHYSDSDIKICKLQDCRGSMKVIHSLTVLSDGSWTICSYSIEIDSTCNVLMEIPSALTRESLEDLIILLDEVKICPGHPDEELVDFVKSNGGEVFTSQKPLARLDEFAPVFFEKR